MNDLRQFFLHFEVFINGEREREDFCLFRARFDPVTVSIVLHTKAS